MVRLSLFFTHYPEGIKLVSTVFVHPRLKGAKKTRLGRKGFPWMEGVQTLVIFLLRWAAWARRYESDGAEEEPNFEGKRPSPATSLNDVLTSRPTWVENVFGSVNGEPLLNSLIDRWNADLSTAPNDPVRLELKRVGLAQNERLDPAAIEVVITGNQDTIEDARQLDALADDVKRQWEVGSASRKGLAPPYKSVGDVARSRIQRTETEAFREPEHFMFSTGCNWEGCELDHRWRAIVGSKLDQVAHRQGNPFTSLLRRARGLLHHEASQRGLQIGPVKLRAHDQQRLQSIINEIDTRRVFYEEYAFEDPRYCVQSVLACRDQIRMLLRGTWHDKFIESFVRDIDDSLSRFMTKSSQCMPPASAHWHHEFSPFIQCLDQMRLEVWTDVALIIERAGGSLSPILHIPKVFLSEFEKVKNSESTRSTSPNPRSTSPRR
jgi:hypothetical protein